MLDPRNNLTIGIESGSSVTFFNGLNSYRDPETLTLTQATDSLMAGYRKPINALYAEVTANSAADPSAEVRYWNGTEWTQVAGQYDDTKGLSRSGFIQWDRNQEGEQQATIDGQRLYWYRIKLSKDAQLTVQGLNIVFCDLSDLENEFPLISGEQFLGSSSPISTLLNARDAISQRLNLSPWDLLHIPEVRLASVYFCLYKTFFNYSDDQGDTWMEKALHYQDQYFKALDKAKLTIDRDDDGKTDPIERHTQVYKLWR